MLTSLRNSINHLLALAALELFPGVILGEGKVSSTQFSYFFHLPQGRHPELLPLLEEKIKELIKKGVVIEEVEMAAASAVHYFKDQGQPVKEDLILESEEMVIPMVRVGSFYDIAQGEVVPVDGAFIQLFAAESFKEGGQEWLEVSGTAFHSKEELKAFIKHRRAWLKEKPWEEAERLGLLFYYEKMPILLPKGVAVCQKLSQFWRESIQSRFVEVIGDLPAAANALKKDVGEWAKDHENLEDLCAVFPHEKQLLEACISSLQFIHQTFMMLELNAKWVLLSRRLESGHIKQWGQKAALLERALKECDFSYSVDVHNPVDCPRIELKIVDSLGELWAGPHLKIDKSVSGSAFIAFSLLGQVKRLIALLAELQKTKWLM